MTTCTLPGRQMPLPWPLTRLTLGKAGRYVILIACSIHLTVVVTVTVLVAATVDVDVGVIMTNVC